jgi:thiamine pyrophosphate-dependent acetolactate synthase large subunit-like protein
VPTLTTAETAITRLEAHGVRHAFGIPGTHNLPLYRCVAESSIEHVTPRHEQGAGYAADGYARSGGRPAVCLATSGPGVLNLATAVATSYADSIPMLVLAPGMSDSVAGRDTGHLHEARDQRGAMEGVAASAVRVRGPAEAAAAIDAAFARFSSGRPRPAYVEIPLDAMEATGDAPGALPASPALPTPDLEAVEDAAELLRGAGRAAIVLGGGAAGAGAQALDLARLLGCPVITTANGKGTIPERDPLSLGASIRLRAAQRYLTECDVVLAIGTELAESDLWRDPPLPLDGSLIRIDIDPAQRNKNAPATVAIVADADAALRALVRTIGGAERRDRGGAQTEALRAKLRDEALADAGIHQALIAAMEDALDDESIVAGDSTMACYYGAVHLLSRVAPRRFLYPTGFAPLGYAIPAAIGAKVAHPKRKVLALIGDGGAMFTLPELAVAAELALPIAVVVVNDGGYGEIRREMLERGQPPLGVDLASPDFAAAARALGARGETIDDSAALPPILEQAFEASKPTLVELRVD